MNENLTEFATNKIKKLEDINQFRRLADTERLEMAYIRRGGKRFVSFGCNDYLGLSQHTQIKQASANAALKYGTGSGASRLITGNNNLYAKLESKLAKIKNTEDAVVFGSGYLANLGVIPALVDKADLVIADKLVHACIIDGIKLSGAKLLRYRHNDMRSLKKLLIKKRQNYRNCLIATETVFSMDGDLAPITEIQDLASEFGCWILLDDAHGLFLDDINWPEKLDNLILSGTLSKAVGAYGGYVCGSKPFVDYIKSSARSLIFSTALPPAILAAAIKSLEIIAKDKKLRQKPIEKARIFTSVLGMKPATSQIVPIIIGSEKKTLEISEKLEKAGFYVPAIRPPTVPKNTSRLRFSFSAMHEDADIKKLAGSLRSL